MRNLRIAIASLVFSGATLCQSARAADVVETGRDTQHVKVTTERYVVLDKDMSTVQFAAGKADLSDRDRDALKRFVDTVKNEAKLDKIIVAAWSDKEMPAAGQKLGVADRDLAKKRGKAVEKALKTDHSGSVTVYDMAEPAGWISREFNAAGALVRNEGEAKSEKDALFEEIGRKLREHGGPGTAVAIAKWKNEVVAH